MTIERIFTKKTARIAAFLPGLHILYCLVSLIAVPCRRKIAYVGWTAAVLTEY